MHAPNARAAAFLCAAFLCTALVCAGCPAYVTGLRVSMELADDSGDVHQFVVRVTDEGGNLIHACIAPATPAAEPFTGINTWTVLFDDEHVGDVHIEAEGVRPDGMRSMRGDIDYYMGLQSIARTYVILTGNVAALDPVEPCAVIADDAVPAGIPEGSVATIDLRGSDAGIADPDAGAATDSGI